MTTFNEIVARAVALRIMRTATLYGSIAARYDYQQHCTQLNETERVMFDRMIIDAAIQWADDLHASEDSITAVDNDVVER